MPLLPHLCCPADSRYPQLSISRLVPVQVQVQGSFLSTKYKEILPVGPQSSFLRLPLAIPIPLYLSVSEVGTQRIKKLAVSECWFPKEGTRGTKMHGPSFLRHGNENFRGCSCNYPTHARQLGTFLVKVLCIFHWTSAKN